jgi:Pyruvate/2-oxoacid:ferredoxin oxidoreductase delta subunit
MTHNLVINKTCISCDACNIICPEKSVITNGKDYVIDNWSCSQCGICLEVCPEDSIVFKKKEDQHTL